MEQVDQVLSYFAAPAPAEPVKMVVPEKPKAVIVEDDCGVTITSLVLGYIAFLTVVCVCSYYKFYTIAPPPPPPLKGIKAILSKMPWAKKK
ncbi:hypothetical protein M885DRAFT_571753 [Pelagophyceae sp. CCMP2097]|nr:hypothetical protein M885DRAFT_571753 [Pelagophyceae sp. CCMP2097]